MSRDDNYVPSNELDSTAVNAAIDENDPNPVPPRGRVMMIMDENGNASQVTLGAYHIESVHRDSSCNEIAEHAIVSSSQPQVMQKDTVRTHIPLPYDSTASDDYEDRGDRPRKKKSSDGPHFQHVDDEVELDDEDSDQYMHITAPASKLKDVSKVKKDLYHDRPDRQGSRLLRALSVKGSDRLRAVPSAVDRTSSQTSKNSISTVGRLMSLPKQKNTTMDDEKENTISDRPRGSPEGKGNVRSNPQAFKDASQKPNMRRSISSVGRILSKSRSKRGTVHMPVNAPVSRINENVSNSDNVLPERPRVATDSGRIGERPGKSKTIGGVRTGIRQIGRTMSMNRSKKVENRNQPQVSRKVSDSGSSSSRLSADRQRSKEITSTSTGSRKGLSHIGRTLSKLRPKVNANRSSSPQSSSTISPCTGSSNDPFDESSGTSLGGISAGSSHLGSRADRESTKSNTSSIASSNNSSKKAATRKALKATGRALSLSRKPKQEARDAWSAAHTAALPGKEGEADADVIEPVTAEKIDGRGNSFFFCVVNSEKIKACGLLGEDSTKIRIPVLVFAEYAGPVSRSRWFIDAFTLPHNAVRQECMDVYDILMAIAKQGDPGDITNDDISDFYDWWVVAREFFYRYFDMERKVMFPWVDAAGTDDWEVKLALRKMRGMKDKLRGQLDKLQTVWELRKERLPEETYSLVYKAIDSFVPKLMNYFKDQEILLPAIVKGFYTIDDRLKMDKEMVAVFAGDSGSDGNRDGARHHVVLLARWISNPRQMRAWISKNLSSSGRSMFPKWQEVFEHEHHRIVKTFRNRVVVDKS